MKILNNSYVPDASAVKAIAEGVQLNFIEYDVNELANMSNAQIKKLCQQALGLKSFGMPYLFTKEQVKVKKSNKLKKELNIVMHFTPGNSSGYQTCPGASKGCLAACLNTSGKGRLTGTQVGRIKKTRLFFEHRELFGRLLEIELKYWLRYCAKNGMSLAARPNGTSDIRWEIIFPWMFEGEFSEIQFYDYTKLANRFNKPLPSNYHLTFSKSEDNQRAVNRLIKKGINVAVVFSNWSKAMEEGYKGRECIDGVNSDRRYDDPQGVIVALKALGEARKDTTGFVVHN